MKVPEPKSCYVASPEAVLAPRSFQAMQFWIDRVRELGRPVPEPRARA